MLGIGSKLNCQPNVAALGIYNLWWDLHVSGHVKLPAGGHGTAH